MKQFFNPAARLKPEAIGWCSTGLEGCSSCQEFDSAEKQCRWRKKGIQESEYILMGAEQLS